MNGIDYIYWTHNKGATNIGNCTGSTSDSRGANLQVVIGNAPVSSIGQGNPSDGTSIIGVRVSSQQQCTTVTATDVLKEDGKDGGTQLVAAYKIGKDWTSKD